MIEGLEDVPEVMRPPFARMAHTAISITRFSRRCDRLGRSMTGSYATCKSAITAIARICPALPTIGRTVPMPKRLAERDLSADISGLPGRPDREPMSKHPRHVREANA